jgi:glycosyltransferase involved in cell wall biosynthesis
MPTAGPPSKLAHLLARAKRIHLALARRTLPLRRYAARKVRIPPAPAGVNLIGYTGGAIGLGQAARAMAAAMTAADVPFAVSQLQGAGIPVQDAPGGASGEKTLRAYDTTLICSTADDTQAVQTRLPSRLFASRYVIGNWFWELPEFPNEWLTLFRLVDEIWAGSRFIQDAIAAKSPVPVVRIPPAIYLDPFPVLPRSHFDLPDNQFLFFHSCDAGGFLARKNPLGVVRAFKMAFERSDRRAALVIKLLNANLRPAEADAVRAEIGDRSNIHLIERLLTRAELNALLATSDCYASLHRAEGFGLLPAEAMSLGKPAILTNWSGNTDYMTPDNSVGIGYQLVRVGQDHGPYKADQWWAEPDLDEAAGWMRRLVSEPTLGIEIGGRGRQTIEAEFSPQVVGESIRSRLRYLRRLA